MVFDTESTTAQVIVYSAKGCRVGVVEGTKEPHPEKKGKAAKRDGTDSAAAMTEEAEETAAEEKERMLQEQRSKGVHSSQQKIKVVGLSSS